MKKNFSVKEAAKLIGVSTNTIYTYLKEGKLGSRRIGRGRFKIPYKELLPYIDIEKTLPLPVSGPSPNNPIEELTEQQTSMKSNKQTLLTPSTANRNNVNDDPGRSTSIFLNTNLQDDPPSKVFTNSGSVSFSNADIMFFRMFKSLAMIGLGIIYLVTNPANISFNPGSSLNLSTFFTTTLPFGLLAGGLAGTIGCLKPSLCNSRHSFLDYFLLLVLGYYAFLSLVNANYGLFVFTASLCGATVEHVVSGFKNSKRDNSFLSSFAKYSLLLAILGGAVIAVYPFLFPISSVVGYITENREVFALAWFLLLIAPSIYILSSIDKQTFIRVPFFTLASFFALVAGVKSMLIPNWDIAYISILSGVFGLFLAWWVMSDIVFEVRKIGFLFGSFAWITAVILISFVAIDNYRHRLEKKAVDELQTDLNEVSFGIKSEIEKRNSVLISFSGNFSLKEAIKSEDPEAAISKAREIYDQTEDVSRVLIYDKNGVAVGVYPRHTLAQDTNFSSREYFIRTVSSKRGYLTDFIDSIVNTKATMQTMPVFENNEVIGMIALATKAEDYQKAFIDTQPSEYEAEAKDSFGNIVFSNVDEEPSGDAGIYALANTKNSHISLSRNIGDPNWDLTVSRESIQTLNDLAVPTMGLILIILLNIIFSLTAGVYSAKKEKPITSDVFTYQNNLGIVSPS